MDLTQSQIEARPGYAIQLVNYEVSLKGGYRRINGFAPVTPSIVPGVGPVVGVAAYRPDIVDIAARQSATDTTKYNIYYLSGINWIKMNSFNLNFTSGMHVWSTQYDWNGTSFITFTDGVNHAYRWDGATLTNLNASGSPADPKYCIAFAGYLFLGGYSSNSAAITISAPLNDNDYTPVDGAATVVVGDTEITGFAIWRAQLIIFCRTSIWKITGNSTDYTSATPFTLSPITLKIGCVEGRTIQECDGDILFLAPDGIRTISGTFNIGDTEIASISRPIQSILSNITSVGNCHSCVIYNKTQYRLFFPNDTDISTDAMGVIGGIRRFRDGHEGWEWGQLQGFKPNCVSSQHHPDGTCHATFGGYDGYVYHMENGSTFSYISVDNPYLYDTGVKYDFIPIGGKQAVYDNITYTNSPIGEIYTTVPLDLGDVTLRKALQRIRVYYFSETTNLNLFMNVLYDYNKPGSIQPPAYQLAGTTNSVLYNTNVLYDSGADYDTILYPAVRQLVQGSGFLTQLQFTSTNNSDPYIIQGFDIEYFPCGRR